MRTIDLESLAIFRTVVEEGGVVRAAEKLHRVPSNVTTRVRQLEEYLGVRLFRREGRTLSLSAEGQTLLNYSVRLLRLADEAVNELRTGKPQGTFRLGSLESTAGSRLAPILSRYHTENPEVIVELITGTTGTLINRVMNFELEAAFVSEPFTAPELEALPVFREELVLITPREIEAVRTAKDLGRSTMIAFAHGCSYRKRLEDWLGSGNVMPERALEFGSYQGMIACVAAGTGFAIVPKSVLVALQATEKVNQHPLPERVSTNRTHLIWRGQPSLALERLINQLQAQDTSGLDVEALLER
ncbi:LysR family transcriptional regulator [Aromatoleum diolicum]|uniref:LysR family transcriptional regulator n=1 Tax=Aromatoleum diolicum TaxID=75796 RepID=A0ABX1QCV8_9RHOO|nr:LysR family transcriptional regulator [Aromatoleum diolicum]NMG76234.1 LysR family transcriptional regulator [Aromatoleum diolicum]